MIAIYDVARKLRAPNMLIISGRLVRNWSVYIYTVHAKHADMLRMQKKL